MFRLFEHLDVGETDNAKIKRCEDLFPFLVGLDLLLVDIAIHFNNQGCAGAAKVNDEPVDRMLAVKSMPG